MPRGLVDEHLGEGDGETVGTELVGQLVEGVRGVGEVGTGPEQPDRCAPPGRTVRRGLQPRTGVALATALEERGARAWFEAAADGPTRWRAPIGLLRARANLADTPDALDELADQLRGDGLAVPLAEVLIDQAAWHHRRERWSQVWETVESAIRVVIPLGLAGWVPRLDRLEPPEATEPETTVPAVLESLTSAERRVALAVSRGLTNKAAAEELYLSVKTVDSHLQRIYPKLGVRSRGELTAAVHGSLGEQQRSA